jgi:hypothetical protein
VVLTPEAWLLPGLGDAGLEIRDGDGDRIVELGRSGSEETSDGPRSGDFGVGYPLTGDFEIGNFVSQTCVTTILQTL